MNINNYSPSEGFNVYPTGNIHPTEENTSTLRFSPEEFTSRLLDNNFPDGLKIHVEGDVNLSGSTGLTSLPENLHIEGALSLSGCTSLTSIGDNLCVEGDLDLSGCTSLTSIGDDVSVIGNLDLRGLKSLISIQDGLSVKGHLYLSDCTNLTSIGDNLCVEGDLDLSGCTSLTSIGDYLFARWSLKLQDCTSLTSIGDNISVEGNVNLRGCTSLTSIGENVSVERSLYLSGCTSLISIQDGLSVKGHLYLSDCTSLTSIGDNISVEGDLDLSGCTSLTSIGNNLSVRMGLDLSGCTSLTSLPEDLPVTEDLYLYGCTSLTSLPSSITQKGSPYGRNFRFINLLHTGLSMEIIKDVNKYDNERTSNEECLIGGGIRRAFPIYYKFPEKFTEPSRHFSSIKQGLKFWADLAQEQEVPELQFQKTHKKTANKIIRFLELLSNSKDYKNKITRVFLAKRLMDVFKEMRRDPTIKENAADLICEKMSERHDLISTLNEIELMIRIHQIEDGDRKEAQLKELGKSLLALRMVNEKTKDYIPTLRFVDEVEVYLVFQIGLADRFNLPVNKKHMIFRRCAKVTDQQIQRFGNEIQEELTEERLNAFLETWSPWQKHKRESEIPGSSGK